MKYPTLFARGNIASFNFHNLEIKAPTPIAMSNMDGTVSERLTGTVCQIRRSRND